MPLTFTTGNIWTMEGIPVIPVNCVGVMGAGLALQCKHRLPEVFKQYKKDSSSWAPGHVHFYTHDVRPVILLATKLHYAAPSRQSWIELGLINLKAKLPKLTQSTDIILLPPIGCGLGRLQWSIIKPLVIKHLKVVVNPIHVLEPKSYKVTDPFQQ